MCADEQPGRPLGEVQRFGVMGGSFNPVHVGHLSIAQQVLNAMQLERVFLMPAYLPPHKQGDRDMADGEDRLEMCRLAAGRLKGLAVTDLELRRGGVSYTVDTARLLREAYGPKAEIRFIIGSDSLVELPLWKDISTLLELTDFAVAARREAPLDEAAWEKLADELGAAHARKLRKSVVPIEKVDVSSTQIRELLGRGEKIPGYLRRDVEQYIRTRGLYGAPPASH